MHRKSEFGKKGDAFHLVEAAVFNSCVTLYREISYVGVNGSLSNSSGEVLGTELWIWS